MQKITVNFKRRNTSSYGDMKSQEGAAWHFRPATPLSQCEDAGRVRRFNFSDLPGKIFHRAVQFDEPPIFIHGLKLVKNALVSNVELLRFVTFI